MQAGLTQIRILAKPLLNITSQEPVIAIFGVCLRCNSFCRYCNLPLNQKRYEMSRETLRGIDALRGFPRPCFIVCITSKVNRHELFDIGGFARRKGMVPIFGAYHWSVGKYGKQSDLLQYEPVAMAGVFRQVIASGLAPRGYFADYVEDTANWLEGKAIWPCDVGRSSIAIDASGNVSPCLARPPAGNLLRSNLNDILGRFDRAAIKRCSNASSCNLICARIVAKNMRHPVSGLVTLPALLRKPKGVHA